MKHFALVAFLALPFGACATANTISEESLPRFGDGLELARSGVNAYGEAYDSLCIPAPTTDPLLNVCPKLLQAFNATATGLNTVGEVYQEVNNKVKAAQ